MLDPAYQFALIRWQQDPTVSDLNWPMNTDGSPRWEPLEVTDDNGETVTLRPFEVDHQARYFIIEQED